mgnify:CR=1 FL=1
MIAELHEIVGDESLTLSDKQIPERCALLLPLHESRVTDSNRTSDESLIHPEPCKLSDLGDCFLGQLLELGNWPSDSFFRRLFFWLIILHQFGDWWCIIHRCDGKILGRPRLNFFSWHGSFLLQCACKSKHFSLLSSCPPSGRKIEQSRVGCEILDERGLVNSTRS